MTHLLALFSKSTTSSLGHDTALLQARSERVSSEKATSILLQELDEESWSFEVSLKHKHRISVLRRALKAQNEMNYGQEKPKCMKCGKVGHIAKNFCPVGKQIQATWITSLGAHSATPQWG